jgi:hypothetical protein
MFRVAGYSTAVLVLTLAALPRLVAAEDKTAGSPFNGRDLEGWKAKNPKNNKWVVGRASLDPKDPSRLAVTVIPPAADGGPAVRELINNLSRGDHGTDLYTEAKFGDCTIELEVMIPKGSNSGIYVMGLYEVQILDSYGKVKVGPGDMGGIYTTAAPKTNACKKPGEWQKFVIEFQAPRFDAAGKKTSNARFVKVVLNDEVIHQNVEVKGPTPGNLGHQEAPTGPLMFQGDHGAVAFRNIKVLGKGR